MQRAPHSLLSSRSSTIRSVPTIRIACRVKPADIPQIYFKNQVAPTGQAHPTHLPLQEVLNIVIDSFTSATERHIEVSIWLSLISNPPFPRPAIERVGRVPVSRICMHDQAADACHSIQVGDGLEMYIVLAKGQSLQSMGMNMRD